MTCLRTMQIVSFLAILVIVFIAAQRGEWLLWFACVALMAFSAASFDILNNRHSKPK